MNNLHLLARTHLPSPRVAKNLDRRMRRILCLMIEGGAHRAAYHGELGTDGTRWYVGVNSVNPAAARQLLDLGLLIHCSRDDQYDSYSFSASACKKVSHLLAGSTTAPPLEPERIATQMLAAYLQRNNDQRAVVSRQ